MSVMSTLGMPAGHAPGASVHTPMSPFPPPDDELDEVVPDDDVVPDEDDELDEEVIPVDEPTWPADPPLPDVDAPAPEVAECPPPHATSANGTTSKAIAGYARVMLAPTARFVPWANQPDPASASARSSRGEDKVCTLRRTLHRLRNQARAPAYPSRPLARPGDARMDHDRQHGTAASATAPGPRSAKRKRTKSARPRPTRCQEVRDPRALDAAIARGRAMVLARQRADGSWQERGNMGPFTTALAVVSLKHVGALSAGDVRDAARWLRAQQRPDGSFVMRPFADEGDLAATAAGWAALALSPHPDDTAAAARAQAFVEERGGVDAVVGLAATGDLSALVLAMAGLVDAARIPTVPLSIVLVPKLVELLSQRVAFYGITTTLAASLIARRLSDKAAPSGLVRGFVAERERARAVELLTLYQNRNGSLMNVVYHTALLVPALCAAGLPKTDPRVAKAIAWLRERGARDDDGLFFDVYGSDIWSTASYLRVLLVSGSSRADEAVTRAVSFLLAEQCTRPHPVLTNRKPGAPRVGGWGFQSGEDAYPDCDTTSAVLDALGRALVPDSPEEVPLPPALATRACAAIAAARAWLLAMQNEDGGWPSFFWGHPTKRPGPIMMRPMRLALTDLTRKRPDPERLLEAIVESAEHVADPSTEDVTSRVLSALARTGTRLEAAEVRRALEFLASQQCPSGAFWGRWKVNYLPATAGVLVALAHLGDDPSKDKTQRALTWVTSRQNADGGFGESVASYRDPGLAGSGPSTAPLTGSVLLGLAEAGAAEAEAAAEYLLASQQPDGAWPNGDCVATLVPPDLFYVYGGASRYIPLEALARHRAKRNGRAGA
jgi:squalene-hopene/tetraprenyl-beta-curcumene cyclase